MSDGPRLPKWIMWTIRADAWLLVKVFLPPVWWVDRRWHINQYDLAAKVFIAALAMCIAQNVCGLFLGHWVAAGLGTFASFAMTWIYTRWLKLLAQASKDYERDPSVLTRPQQFFHWMSVPPGRLMFILMGVEMVGFLTFPLRLTGIDILRTVLINWTWLLGAGMYIAGVPHTPIRRKPKKEKKARELFAPAPLGSPI